MGAGVRAARPPPRRGLFPRPRPRDRPRGAWWTGGRSVRRPAHVEPELAPAVAAAPLRGKRIRGAGGDIRQPADWPRAVGSGEREQGAVPAGTAWFTAPCSRLPAPIESLDLPSHIDSMRVT